MFYYKEFFNFIIPAYLTEFHLAYSIGETKGCQSMKQKGIGSIQVIFVLIGQF